MRNGGEFICTQCEEELVQGTAESRGRGAEGKLVCPKCGRQHPVVSGIPRFVTMENYATSFGFQWNRHARTQLDSHTGLPISKERLFATTGWPGELKGQKILEAGCGAGRFTEVLLQTGADVYSFDYSDAVTANKSNNGSHPNLHLFQGDIFDIPFPTQWFDKVMCLGVLQHTPDPERAFKSLAQFVRPGGDFVIDLYRSGLLARLQWKYMLRPITKRMNPRKLYNLLSGVVPPLIGATVALRRLFGRAGARLSPILEYSDLGLSDDLNRDWSVLDTFDMYAPAHDHPQSVETVRRWFSEIGFVDVVAQRGPNGVIGKGRRPHPDSGS